MTRRDVIIAHLSEDLELFANTAGGMTPEEYFNEYSARCGGDQDLYESVCADLGLNPRPLPRPPWPRSVIHTTTYKIIDPGGMRPASTTFVTPLEMSEIIANSDNIVEVTIVRHLRRQP